MAFPFRAPSGGGDGAASAHLRRRWRRRWRRGDGEGGGGGLATAAATRAHSEAEQAAFECKLASVVFISSAAAELCASLQRHGGQLCMISSKKYKSYFSLLNQ